MPEPLQTEEATFPVVCVAASEGTTILKGIMFICNCFKNLEHNLITFLSQIFYYFLPFYAYIGSSFVLEVMNTSIIKQIQLSTYNTQVVTYLWSLVANSKVLSVVCNIMRCKLESTQHLGSKVIDPHCSFSSSFL